MFFSREKVAEYLMLLKGRLIWEGNFGVFRSLKKWTFFLRISALVSKIDQINKIIYKMINDLLQKKGYFLEGLKTPKLSSWINWPLVHISPKHLYWFVDSESYAAKKCSLGSNRICGDSQFSAISFVVNQVRQNSKSW